MSTLMLRKTSTLLSMSRQQLERQAKRFLHLYRQDAQIENLIGYTVPADTNEAVIPLFSMRRDLVCIAPGQTVSFSTGLYMETYEFDALIETGVNLPSYPIGVIHSNYRMRYPVGYKGEVHACVHNSTPEPLRVVLGQRIGTLIF